MKKIAILFISALLSLGVLTGCSTEQKNEESKIPEKPILMTFNESKSYEESATYESGIITVSDVVLKNATFNGDLTIDKSVGEGGITLDSIKVNGKLIIQGGGSNSIHIDNSDIKSMESGKEGTPVRIVVSENTVVQNAELSGHTNLEVSGQITSLNVKPEAKATDIAFQPNSKVEKVEVNAPTSLLVQAPITDLNLKAASKVSLEAAVENVRVEAAAQNTTINVAKDVVVANLATETKVEVSGEGKLTTVLTTDAANVTGNIKAETTTVNENPIQESNKEVVAATPTPVATNAPKPTVVPTKAPATPVPTVEPTPVPPSTPNPTPVPTPSYTVNFVLEGYLVESQIIKQGEKITKPVVSLKDDVYTDSYVLWLDDSGNIYDFNTSVTSEKTLTGKITADATDQNIIELVADKSVNAMYMTQDITLDRGLTINKDIDVFGNDKKLTITNGDAFIIDNKVKLSLNDLTVDAIGKDSRGISIGYDIDFDITLNSTVLLTNARGISNSGVEDKSKTEKIQSNIFLNNSEIRNKRITDIEADVIYESSRGISLFDSVGTVSINSSKIYGYQYGINVGGDNPRAQDNNLGLDVTVLNSTINAWGAFNIWGSYGNYVIKGSTLKGINKQVGGSNSFSTIVLNNDIYGIFDNQKAFGNKMTIEDSTVTNYQSTESKLSGLSQNLIRVDCGLDKLEFKGTVNLIDETNYTNSAIYLDAMNNKEEVDNFINNSLVITGATINSKTASNKELPLVDNPYVIPTISNANIMYNQESENIVVEFDLDKGFIMQKSWGITDNTALANAYTKLLVNGTTWEKNWELGNDVVLNYYYLDDDSKPVSLLTKGGNPLVKNKYWDGYLNYLDGTETKRLESGTLIPMTYVGEKMLSNRTWSTSTNPFTQTVSEGWLDAAKGHTVCVDIVVVYNNEIIKQTVSVDIPYETSVWDGEKVDTSWFENDKDTFELINAEQLAGFAQLVNSGNTFQGKTIKLSNDLDLNSKNWTPIGTIGTKPFMGTFDGNNKVISNLVCSQENSDLGTGLFGYMKTPGVIKNVIVNNANLKGKAHVGTIIGSYYTGNLENCKVQGNIEIIGNYKVGGLIGFLHRGVGVINSTATGNVSSNATNDYVAANNISVGGFIGETLGAKSIVNILENCSVAGIVTGPSVDKAGALVGYLRDDVTTIRLINCTWAGSLAEVGNGHKISETNDYTRVVLNETKVLNEIEIENEAPIVDEENEIVEESVPSEEPIPTETTEPSAEPLELEIEVIEDISE
ncbi:MAG: hypothetical protein ACK5L6_12245 [Anaerorhabdus sp.]|uniref:hypothetical protein n=1 Tax=Anaerorhabdus sp. TaxID=1872524 RepID=UPI003A89685E